ncbi:helix-turn-helix domain-containing protein [Vibrio sp. V27_P1S3P104]|uniref:helix-turn-helix domain-containing protein n=3 Tax=Vibrio TaxID=662 RepID=UPI001372AC19|nr:MULTISPECIES: AraC family transcriptional regulator [unclassified Vibrio]NAW68332.1 helix-turn-helix domain-containing protein [Vibrio sp. V28_P6S34P95]NAX05233.1 helix-turn-helix domain-containing protein [Vibrio sp. V30_P3S12P165]NAX33047.1 helix-turn-helix domain-containing protein [Vibrio sp. V29_P1S30P107]NAX36052.1 helix-turn-helix domain-containing protein [Vibrio sp. V27_P1S3P104]NAX39125.1 helix-turn-helix domain-containing protein [Vibrio sp. V26_P1S5P106]
MSITYQLHHHLRYPHFKFAYVDGHHHSDFGLHKHDFSELFLVVSGKGNHLVASHVYPLSAGDVFVINGDTEHAFQNVDQLIIINLMFEAGTPFFETPSLRMLSGYQAMFKVEPIARQTRDYQAKLTLNALQLSIISQLIESIRREYQNGESGFETMLTSLMQQLVITLARMYQQQTHDLPKTTLALSRALIFIEQHFTDSGLHSGDIAQAAFVSQRQLERLFKQFLNTSPNLYLREMQLNYGRTLLSNDRGVSIQHVAEQCGFSDSNYFSKCFKQKFGQSPRQYMAQQK